LAAQQKAAADLAAQQKAALANKCVDTVVSLGFIPDFIIPASVMYPECNPAYQAQQQAAQQAAIQAAQQAAAQAAAQAAQQQAQYQAQC